jgi:hypothetical protein
LVTTSEGWVLETVLVSEKLAEAAVPTVAVTLYDPPGTPLAVKIGEVTWPRPLVVAVAVAALPNTPLGPDAGAVNVTVAPLAGLPPESITVAASGDPKAVFSRAL